MGSLRYGGSFLFAGMLLSLGCGSGKVSVPEADSETADTDNTDTSVLDSAADSGEDSGEDTDDGWPPDGGGGGGGWSPDDTAWQGPPTCEEDEDCVGLCPPLLFLNRP